MPAANSRKYASETQVPIGESKTEIERLLTKFGATQFAYGWDRNRALIGFSLGDRQIRITLPLPSRLEFETVNHGAGRVRYRSQAEIDAAQEKVVMQRWRSLVLVIKAKLVAVDDGISTIEREFLPDVVLPDGETVGQWLQPQLENVYKNETMPALLPGLGDRSRDV